MQENETPRAIVTFSSRELVEVLIRHHGITKGIWMLHVEFVMGAGSIPGPEGKALPTALIGMNKIGLAEVSALNDLAVDASTISKPKTKKSKTAS